MKRSEVWRTDSTAESALFQLALWGVGLWVSLSSLGKLLDYHAAVPLLMDIW